MLSLVSIIFRVMARVRFNVRAGVRVSAMFKVEASPRVIFVGWARASSNVAVGLGLGLQFGLGLGLR